MSVEPEDAKNRIVISREEYDALVAAAETNAQSSMQMRSLRETCTAQAKIMLEVDLKLSYLERVNSMQEVMLEMLRSDVPTIASLETLSVFWQRWIIETSNAKSARKLTHDEVVRTEPSLFTAWREHLLKAGKVDRSVKAPAPSTRADYEEAIPKTPAAKNDATVERLRDENIALKERIAKLTADMDDWKKAHVNAEKRR